MKSESGKVSLGGLLLGLLMIILIGVCVYLSIQIKNINETNNQYIIAMQNAQQKENTSEEKDEQNKLDGKLTGSELEVLEEYLNENINNIFLTSYYEEIEEIDLYSALLDGTNLSTEPEDTIAKEYKEITGEEPITDVNKYTTADLKEFLKEKTGVEFDLEKTNLASKATYSEKYDAYYIQAGDTNYSPVICSSGYKSGNKYVISGEYSSNATMTGKYTVTLKEVDDNYLFVSNVEEKKDIDDEEKDTDTANQYSIFSENYNASVEKMEKNINRYNYTTPSLINSIYVNDEVAYLAFSDGREDVKVLDDVRSVYTFCKGNSGDGDIIFIKNDGTVEIITAENIYEGKYTTTKRNDLKDIIYVLPCSVADYDESGAELGGHSDYKFVDISGNIFE